MESEIHGCPRQNGVHPDVRRLHSFVVDSGHERRFVALFGRDDRLVGALAFSRPRLLMAYRKLLAAKTSFEDAIAHAAQVK